MARNMGRLISSKPTDQSSQKKQGVKNSNEASGNNSSNAYSKGSNIADVVQGFVQAQANITNNSASNEIISLLQQVNDKLSQIQSGSEQEQQANDNNQQQSNEKPEQQSGQQENSEQQANNMVAQELQNLFSQILQPNNTKGQNANKETDPQQESKGQISTKTTAVQTASQVLAQAQYELANELEASLQKLKQVISDSEKIANQISNLLGESNNKE